MAITAAFLWNGAHAQVKLDLSINIGNQPVWGPAGYDHAEYYYLPDLDAYYDVPRHRYIYWENGRRIFAPVLPSRFHNPDLYGSYKVVINEPKAYLHHDQHVVQYAQYRGRHGQQIIRDSHEEKYFQVKDHPEHAKWRGNDHDRGRDHEGDRH